MTVRQRAKDLDSGYWSKFCGGPEEALTSNGEELERMLPDGSLLGL